jgi:hypothetical protein
MALNEHSKCFAISEFVRSSSFQSKISRRLGSSSESMNDSSSAKKNRGGLRRWFVGGRLGELRDVGVGRPSNLGEYGEITVSGGRNIFAPLVRYRTGDFGRLELAPCPCGDAMPRLLDLEGRQPLLIRSADGTPVTTVDLSRLLREFPLLLHEFIQHADGSCELLAGTIPGAHIDVTQLAEALQRVLGGLPLEIRFDPALGDRSEGKAMPYRSELMLED